MHSGQGLADTAAVSARRGSQDAPGDLELGGGLVSGGTDKRHVAGGRGGEGGGEGGSRRASAGGLSNVCADGIEVSICVSDAGGCGSRLPLILHTYFRQEGFVIVADEILHRSKTLACVDKDIPAAYLLCQPRSHKPSAHDTKPSTLNSMSGRLVVVEAGEEEEKVEEMMVMFRINLARGARTMTRGVQTRNRGGGLERGRLQGSGRRSQR